MHTAFFFHLVWVTRQTLIEFIGIYEEFLFLDLLCDKLTVLVFNYRLSASSLLPGTPCGGIRLPCILDYFIQLFFFLNSENKPNYDSLCQTEL